jgi:hypothetical protein
MAVLCMGSLEADSILWLRSLGGSGGQFRSSNVLTWAHTGPYGSIRPTSGSCHPKTSDERETYCTQMVDACCSRTWKIRAQLMQAGQPEAYLEDFGCSVGVV